MSEKETIEKVKERQGVFEKIQNVLTGGYGTKEDLREFDKKLRDYYYSDFKAMRHRWEEIYLAALETRQEALGDHFKKVIQILDRIAEKINRADYGYAGLWDRKGSIREKELARTFNYDKALEEDINSIVNAVDEVHKDAEAEKWDVIETKVKNIKSLILDFESKWNEREKGFRPLEI
ncbi:MAG: hypothetical protein JSV51_02260 [Candidatus Bathyarchaeota archaeon]|nr:MAG: hypothetical protein JSV51_02260 [Candidatus Bathyarchaeota archaeon]